MYLGKVGVLSVDVDRSCGKDLMKRHSETIVLLVQVEIAAMYDSERRAFMTGSGWAVSEASPRNQYACYCEM